MAVPYKSYILRFNVVYIVGEAHGGSDPRKVHEPGKDWSLLAPCRDLCPHPWGGGGQVGSGRGEET